PASARARGRDRGGRRDGDDLEVGPADPRRGRSCRGRGDGGRFPLRGKKSGRVDDPYQAPSRRGWGTAPAGQLRRECRSLEAEHRYVRDALRAVRNAPFRRWPWAGERSMAALESIDELRALLA